MIDGLWSVAIGEAAHRSIAEHRPVSARRDPATPSSSSGNPGAQPACYLRYNTQVRRRALAQHALSDLTGRRHPAGWLFGGAKDQGQARRSGPARACRRTSSLRSRLTTTVARKRSSCSITWGGHSILVPRQRPEAKHIAVDAVNEPMKLLQPA